jgi:glycosyltransferase involved in cell wall biosynthesis
VHNEEEFLEGVIMKIVGCEANEIIIVDDGSTDKSRDIARKLEELIPKIKTFRLKRNSEGCGFPREFGARAATGEYVAFCDADIINFDRVDYGKILEAARTRRADLIIGNYTGKVGRITNFVAKPMLRLFFPEIKINRVKTGLFCFNRKLLEHFLKYTRFSRWNSTISLLIFAYMNKYKVIEVDIGELHHTMKPDTKLLQQAEGAIKLILAWAGHYGRMDILSSLTPPGFRREAELLPFISSQVEKGGLRESESLLDDE